MQQAAMLIKLQKQLSVNHINVQKNTPEFVCTKQFCIGILQFGPASHLHNDLHCVCIAL